MDIMWLSIIIPLSCLLGMVIERIIFFSQIMHVGKITYKKGEKDIKQIIRLNLYKSPVHWQDKAYVVFDVEIDNSLKSLDENV